MKSWLKYIRSSVSKLAQLRTGSVAVCPMSPRVQKHRNQKLTDCVRYATNKMWSFLKVHQPQCQASILWVIVGLSLRKQIKIHVLRYMLFIMLLESGRRTVVVVTAQHTTLYVLYCISLAQWFIGLIEALLKIYLSPEVLLHRIFLHKVDNS